MIMYKKARTVSRNDRVSIGNNRFRLVRASDCDNHRYVDVITPRSGSRFLLNVRSVKEGERYEVFRNVFLTILDASKQSRYEIAIEAPTSEIQFLKNWYCTTPTTPESKLFRQVKFVVKGKLYLHRMPGRMEPIVDSLNEIKRCGINNVVCLAPMEEIKAKSPSYAEVLSGKVDWQHSFLPIPDFGIPEKPKAFLSLVSRISSALADGDNVLVHCAGGIGRTGTFAVAVGLALGLPLEEATNVVRSAGSGPETHEQRAFLSGNAVAS